MGRWISGTGWRQCTILNSNSSVATSPTTDVVNPDANVVSLDDFVGTWIAMEGDPGTNTETLTFRLEGNKVLADVDSDHLELSVLQGRKLEGYLLRDEETIPMSAELNQDKTQITFIIRPPNSEIIGSVRQRVSQSSGANADNVPASASGAMSLTEQEALNLLIDLPEIADWMQRVQQEAPMNQAQFEVVETTPEEYLIRAYEMVNNPGEPSHTATLGWYNINRQTGEISSE